MSNSFIYHHFKIVTAMRQSKCKSGQCVPFGPDSDVPFGDGVIQAGEKCLQVTTGSMRSERNSRFCMKCAASAVQHVKDPFDAIMFELEKHKGVREIEDYRPEPRTKDYVNDTLLSDEVEQLTIKSDAHFAYGDIPF